MKRILITTLILFIFPVTSWASFDTAMSQYERKNYTDAAQEFEKLAAQSDNDAQYMLGYMYALGKGVLQDYIEAHKWFNIAASLGNTEAIKARNEVERKMTSQQIYQAQTKARNWKPGLYKKPVLNLEQLNSNTQDASPVVNEAEIQDKQTIKYVQSQLSSLGYQAGSADGIMGSKTRIAIRQYQYDRQLAEDGKVTQTLVNHLFPQGLPEKTAEKMDNQGFFFPETWATSNQIAPDSKSKDELIEQLNRLLEKGRQQRAAQDWFLNELSQLIGQNETPWSTSLLADRFKDGNYTHSPEWRVLSGTFTVNDSGLDSYMIQVKKNTASNTGTDTLSTAILGAIIDHAIKDQQPATAANKNTRPGLASIISRTNIPNHFALMAKLSLKSRNGRIEFGPYSGEQQQGYQLLISPEHNLIELLRFNSQRSAVIESVRRTITLNQPQTIEWLRDETGEMTIALNGKQLFKVTDRQHQEDFSGFMVNNFSSAMTLHEINIVGKK